jgi:hypothetical protein
MKSYLIIYQISLPEASYTNLITYLKTAPQWARPSANTWIIKTTSDVATIRDGVRDRVTKTDKVLVIDVSSANWGTFNVTKEVTDWMKNNL